MPGRQIAQHAAVDRVNDLGLRLTFQFVPAVGVPADRVANLLVGNALHFGLDVRVPPFQHELRQEVLLEMLRDDVADAGGRHDGVGLFALDRRHVRGRDVQLTALPLRGLLLFGLGGLDFLSPPPLCLFRLGFLAQRFLANGRLIQFCRRLGHAGQYLVDDLLAVLFGHPHVRRAAIVERRLHHAITGAFILDRLKPCDGQVLLFALRRAKLDAIAALFGRAVAQIFHRGRRCRLRRLSRLVGEAVAADRYFPCARSSKRIFWPGLRLA